MYAGRTRVHIRTCRDIACTPTPRQIIPAVEFPLNLNPTLFGESIFTRVSCRRAWGPVSGRVTTRGADRATRSQDSPGRRRVSTAPDENIVYGWTACFGHPSPPETKKKYHPPPYPVVINKKHKTPRRVLRTAGGPLCRVAEAGNGI